MKLRAQLSSVSPHPALSTAALVAALLLGNATLALADKEGHKKQMNDNLKQGMDSDYKKGDKQLNIGKKGGEKKSYSVTESKDGKKISVVLMNSNGKDLGRLSKLEYDESTRTVTITAAGKSVPVVINGNNTVNAGGKNCPGTDPDCIAQGVLAAIPNLQSEEVAAMLTVMNDDLHEKQYGEHISSALMQMAAQLTKQSMPAPAGAKGKN